MSKGVGQSRNVLQRSDPPLSHLLQNMSIQNWTYQSSDDTPPIVRTSFPLHGLRTTKSLPSILSYPVMFSHRRSATVSIEVEIHCDQIPLRELKVDLRKTLPRSQLVNFELCLLENYAQAEIIKLSHQRSK